MRGLVAALAAFAISSTALAGSPGAPAISEARLDASGTYHTNAANGGRVGARYQAGSISKYACSLLAMDLQRDGLLSLDDPLTKALPGYRGPGAATITVRNLLQNRTGITDGLMIAFRADPDEVIGLDLSPLQASNHFGAEPTGDAPGTTFDYAITNWILVQAVLEHAGGAPVEDMMQARIFDPADMSTAVLMGGGKLPGSAPVAGEDTMPPLPDYVLCAGGLASTPDDLIRLLRFPYHAGHFTPDMIEQLTDVASPDDFYALGGRVRQVRVGDGIHSIGWESGSIGPFKSYALYDPRADIGYAVMTNEDDYDFIAERRDAWVREGMGGELVD